MGESVFVDHMGNTPQIRVLDTFLLGRGLEYTLSDISRIAKVTRPTLYKMFSVLISRKMITPTRKLGRMQLYVLNQKNPYVQKILTFYLGLAKANSDEYFRKRKKALTVKVT